jgi:antitoxin component of MazEF toxin-antitoxin module
MNKNSFTKREEIMKKLFASITIAALCTNLYAISPYVKGYRLYIRYVKHIPKFGIKAPQLLKKLNIKSSDELKYLISSHEIVKRVAKFNPKAAKGIEKILNKNKEKELEAFLLAVYEGKIPPGCN